MTCPNEEYDLQGGSAYEALCASGLLPVIMANSSRISKSLDGAVVLLVEDDFFIGLEYIEHLTKWGVCVIGPAISDAEARKLLADRPIDAALLDVSIQGGNSFALAADLCEANIPTAFVTAFASDERMFPENLQTLTRLGKPVHDSQLHSLLTTLLSSRFV